MVVHQASLQCKPENLAIFFFEASGALFGVGLCEYRIPFKTAFSAWHLSSLLSSKFFKISKLNNRLRAQGITPHSVGFKNKNANV